jgi:hypothetical protein
MIVEKPVCVVVYASQRFYLSVFQSRPHTRLRLKMFR